MKKIFLTLIKVGFIAYAVLAVIGIVAQMLLMPFEFLTMFFGASMSADTGMAGLHPMATSITIAILGFIYTVILILAIIFGPKVVAALGSKLSKLAPQMAQRQAAKKLAGNAMANKIANSKLGRRAGLNGFNARTGLESMLGEGLAGLGGGKKGDGNKADGDKTDIGDKLRGDPTVAGSGMAGAIGSAIDDIDRRGGKADDATGTTFDPTGTIKSPVGGLSGTDDNTAELFNAPFGRNSDITGSVTADALNGQLKDDAAAAEERALNTPGLARSGDSASNLEGVRGAAATDTLSPPEHRNGDSPAMAAIESGVVAAALSGMAHGLTSDQLLNTEQQLGTNYIQDGQLSPELSSIGGTSVANVPDVTRPITASEAASNPVMQPSSMIPSQSATQIITSAVGGQGNISDAYYTPDATLTQMAQGASEIPRTGGSGAAPQGSFMNQMVSAIGDNPAGTSALGAALGAAIIGSMGSNMPSNVAGGDAMIQAQARAMSDAMAREYENRPGFDRNDRSTWSPELGSKMDALSTAMTGALTAQTAALNQQLKHQSQETRNAIDRSNRSRTDQTVGSNVGSASGADGLGSEGIRDIVKQAISRISEAAMAEADAKAGNNRFIEDPSNRRSVRNAIQGDS